MKDYSAIATEYAQQVVAGEIVACKWVQLACQRQLKDLERQGTEAFPFWFFPELGNRVCAFIELLPHIKGRQWAGQKLGLEPWQMFIITTVFGWVNEGGTRRFKTAYNEIPRKNAKSTLSAGVGLYCLAAEEEPGAEVYSAATTRDQAQIVWKDAKAMVDKTPGLRRRFGVETSTHAIYMEHNNSLFRPLSRDQGGNHDGLNVYCGIIDELHGHKTREMFDVIETGTGSRLQPLLWLITTAGFNRMGICYEQRIYVTKVLQGIAVDETYFGIIFTIDDDDDWTDPRNWAKANPNWGVSVNPEDIERKARKAMTMASAQNNFMTKHLNVWVNADTAWMDMVAWDRCGDPALTLDDFEGQECIIAVDLANKIDVAAMAIIFPPEDPDKGVYHLFTKFYLPEEAVEDERNQFYAGWAKEGRLTITPGQVTDYGYIEDDLKELAARFKVMEVAHDPWQAAYLATRLQEQGLMMVEYRQTVQGMSEPMKWLEALTLSKRIAHNGCPVMAWMVSNVVAHVDAKENIYPRKEQPQNKIDGVVATIMGLGRAMMRPADESLSSHLENHGIRSL